MTATGALAGQHQAMVLSNHNHHHHGMAHGVSTDTSCQYTLSTHPINTPYQHLLLTHLVNPPYPHTLLTLLINPPPINPSHPTLSCPLSTVVSVVLLALSIHVLPIYTPHQPTLLTLSIITHF